jgi:hypothetical protein
MPLSKGSSKKTISKNIKELMHSNSQYGNKQAAAIAYSEARKTGNKEDVKRKPQ